MSAWLCAFDLEHRIPLISLLKDVQSWHLDFLGLIDMEKLIFAVLNTGSTMDSRITAVLVDEGLTHEGFKLSFDIRLGSVRIILQRV